MAAYEFGLRMRALSRALIASEDELPPTRRRLAPGAVPDARNWSRIDEDAAGRLALVRSAVAGIGQRLSIAPEVVLEPRRKQSII